MSSIANGHILFSRFSSIFPSLCLIFSLLISVKGNSKWTPTSLWGECTPACGPGFQIRQFACLAVDRFNTTSLINEKKCGPLPTGDKFIEGENKRVCDWGTCAQKTRWRASPWGICSHPCGDLGVATRDVECVMTGEEGEVVISDAYASSYCELNKKPNSMGPCNRFNCPAEFTANPWNKCEQSDPCKSGFQTRQLSCRSKSMDGSYQDLPKHACYQGRKAPLKTWQRCYIPETAAKCTLNKPVIEEDKMVVVQMRSVGKMQLQVGQEAYILPGTRLSIKCPVKFYAGINVVWKNVNRGEFRYEGHQMTNTHVSKSGRLVIRHFSHEDKGEWKCFAGEESAAITLNYNQPSAGHSDWVQRDILKNREMMHDDPGIVMNRQELVQWVKHPWSNCSVPCGGQGIQKRIVRCERIGTGVYHVLEDAECKRQLLTKPKTERICTNLPKCPKWNFKNPDYLKCTDKCIAIGMGTYEGYMTCTIGEQEIPTYHCDNMTKPDVSCKNPNCQVMWKVSPWSTCSQTCGGSGFQYREHQCLWKGTKKSAGSLCYDAKIEAPTAIKKCTTLPCKTVCLDLSDDCQSHLNWCGYKIYQYHCCASCRKQAIEQNHLNV